ncbi:hypothetical protein HZS_5877, partial [Henneguya salminicola]
MISNYATSCVGKVQSLNDLILPNKYSCNGSVDFERSTLFDSIADSKMFIPYDEICVIKNLCINTVLTIKTEPLDIHVEGGHLKCDPIRISKINSNSKCAFLLQEQDYILSVNDIPLCYMEHEQAIQTINACKPNLSFVNGQIISPICAAFVKTQLLEPNFKLIDVIIYRSKNSIRQGNILYFQNPIFRGINEDYIGESIIKVYKISKFNNMFGINIVGGCRDYPIFIVGIEHASIAFNVNMFIGDQILKINDLEVSLMDQPEFVRLIKNLDEVTLLSINNISGLKKFCSYIEHLSHFKSLFSSKYSIDALQDNDMSLPFEKRTEFIVRTLCTFDSSKERSLPFKGVSFKFGDFLHIQNGSNPEWWRAEKLDVCGNSSNPPIIGIIPSDQKMISRQSKSAKSVQFKISNPIYNSNKFSFRRGRNYTIKKSLLSSTSSSNLEKVNNYFNKNLPIDNKAYEMVVKLPYTKPRPILIFGVFRKDLIDHFISEFPDRFSVCPMHYSKFYPTEETIDSSKLIYVQKDIMIQKFNQNKYIELNSRDKELCGICIDDIKDISNNGKHSFINVTHNATKKLIANQIYPIVVLIKLNNVQAYSQHFNSCKMDYATKMLKNIQLLEQYHSDIFT